MTQPVGVQPKKGPALRTWIRDRVVFLALIIFGVGMAGYISADLLLEKESIWLHPVKEFSLLISMIGVVSLGYELFLRELTFNEYKEALQEIVNPDAVRLGIRGIYKNRSELAHAHNFEDLFRHVKKEIFIGGSSLLSISTGSRDLIREKVLAGIRVRLLVMDPDSEVVEIITRQIGGKATFLNEIKTSLLLFQKLEEELDEIKAPGKGTLEVHTYKTIPSHSFISVDAHDPGGIIIADIGPYLGKSHQRPSMMLVRKRGALFDQYENLANAMWEESHPVITQLTIGTTKKTKASVFASGIGTEVFDNQASEWIPAVLCQLNSKWRGIKGAQWVAFRDKVTLEEAKTGGRYRFRFNFNLPNGKATEVNRADLFVRADDTCHISINGKSLPQEFGGADFADPFLLHLGPHLKEGENSIEFEVINYARPNAQVPEDNPLGLIYRMHLEYPG
ncbi:MAG: hypothetical protein G3M70_00960 [Candidatus Nitronauta litoralis]|uniref:Uncharacterized protein n=1 Tax=Candidatus Nitronauta litoralis TaxID=2705533 RepID=A0A7T0BTE1_9BACT|nr:MAG: hypothetical protein G3M70_00960 [Candidatus Nitronauta litoralis]